MVARGIIEREGFQHQFDPLSLSIRGKCACHGQHVRERPWSLPYEQNKTCERISSALSTTLTCGKLEVRIGGLKSACILAGVPIETLILKRFLGICKGKRCVEEDACLYR
jgi:hypothetical protein